MLTLSPAEARSILLHAAGFGRPLQGDAPCRDLLDALGVIQLDPLDRVGTNADLVAFARIPEAPALPALPGAGRRNTMVAQQ